ncbi:MarR family transcriptional regulator [Corynebacterium incognita]|uniref:MarR family transcriptional regulator n=1 Tax=Corynebacterium incognita TaxID=2754725 RepID=A0A7G7CPR1_9CORY|nr:MarR family transcriptional regulator [Corynebacterium incognita]QNE89577.1 MarR family transcriptional regulator [Corynebacterium incognita]
MFAVHARYRGRNTRRADYVERAAEALATLPGVSEFDILGVEDICANVADATAVTNLVMALLADGEWAVGIGVHPGPQEFGVRRIATAALRNSARAGVVKVRVQVPKATTEADDISSTFALLAHVLHKRTAEGREATSLVRSGLDQNEAAAELGISKQAMSQRLQAAGWAAEQAGWQLAVNLLQRANPA